MSHGKQKTLRDTLLVLRAQSGDREALDRLLRSIQNDLYRYARGLVGDPAMAEDVLQDVFLSICRNLRLLREPRVFRAWAYRITSRRALAVARRERKRGEVPWEAAGVEPEATEPSFEPGWLDELPALLGELSHASRAVLSLHYLEDMSLQETADVLEIPVGTAKSRLAYGLAAIRRLLPEKASRSTRKEIEP